MDRTKIINFFIQNRNYKRYLEIGVFNEQHNFAHIKCEYKIGVDINPVTTYQGSSDDFFNQNQERFDLIFIDGFHQEELVLSDIGNSIRILSPGGMIILHDCLPPDAWHQREFEDFKEGENWNGQVWKAVLRVFNFSQYKCSIIDVDWGCGIIDTANRQSPALHNLRNELYYHQDYSRLRSYIIRPAEFIRKYVKVFYHLACMGNWKLVFNEQMQMLVQNGFSSIKISVLGGQEELDYVFLIGRELDLHMELIYNGTDFCQFEKPAMLSIEDYAKTHEGYVLYLHSKGVSNPYDQIRVLWRRLMMRELVENWESCMLYLLNYDIIGVNWREMHPVAHFSGNFWYTSTKYLRSLPDFESYYNNPRFNIINNPFNKRFGCEFWIGATESPNFLSLKCKNIDFSNKLFWKKGAI